MLSGGKVDTTTVFYRDAPKRETYPIPIAATHGGLV